MTTEQRTRRKFTDDFKRDTVALITEQRYKVSEAARSLDVGENQFRRWKQQFEAEATGDMWRCTTTRSVCTRH
jgi:transposase-like protein